jgi:hypothetical protein
MRNHIYLFFLFLLTYNSLAQDIAIGDWRTHLPYKAGLSITETNNNISCATSLSLFSYDLEDQSIETYSKVSGLSGIGIQKIAYSSDRNVLMVVYDDANIDLVYSDQIYNISDVQRKNMVGQKQINNIAFYDELAYLSFSFGIVLLDIDKKEIRDTYVIGDNGDQVQVNAVVIHNDSIYAACEEGIKKADTANINLSNFNFWDSFLPIKGVNGSSESIIKCRDTLFAEMNDTLFYYNGIKWLYYYASDWDIIDVNSSYGSLILTEYSITGETVNDVRISENKSGSWEFISSSKIYRPLEAIRDKDGVLWIVDNWQGLIRYESGNFNYVIPNGPTTTDVYEIHASNNEVWVAPGGIDQSWQYLYKRVGIYSFKSGVWDAYTKYLWSPLDSMLDIICVDRSPITDHLFFGSYGGGLLEYEGDGVFKVHKQNSSLGIIPGDAGSYRITGLEFDDQGRLWVSNYGAENPISVLKKDGQWISFKPNISLGNNYVSDLVIDDAGHKWIIMPRGNGILVFDDNGTLEDPSDDQYKKLVKGAGSGNLPSIDIYSIAKDKDGEIWVGTGEGVAVFYCPESIFSESGCDAQQIAVEQDGYIGYLFETEEVRSIAVDGANRKWFGTTNGVWLMSESGTEELLRFNADNSFLLSDYIIDIGINDETGEVFFGTDQGMVSYKSTSTGGVVVHDEVYAYPNPVYPEYTGTIAIKGLVDDADVKITDISGKLIYSTKALGGQAVWSGMDYNGERAQTGVYLIWSSNETGSQTNVTKLLLFN